MKEIIFDHIRMGSSNSSSVPNEEETEPSNFVVPNQCSQPTDVNGDIEPDIADPLNLAEPNVVLQPAEVNGDLEPESSVDINQGIPPNFVDPENSAILSVPFEVNQNIEPENFEHLNENIALGKDPDEIEDQKHLWRRLPTSVLEKVFSNLNFRERAIASLVCLQWSDAYECPSLWYSVNLCFSKGERTRPCFNPKSIVQRFGRYFRHLGVFCRNERRRKVRLANQYMADFFHDMVLADVQLQSFKMPRLSVLTPYVKGEELLPVSESFRNFLRRQTGLTTVDFNRGRTFTGSCLMILETLVADNVENLLLEGFFVLPAEILNVTFFPRYVEAITRFHHLRSLFVNYRYLTDEVVTSLAHNLDGSLEVLGVFLETTHTVQNFVSTDSWITLKQRCPQMRVHYKMELNNMKTTKVIETGLLSPVMPIESIIYYLNPHWTSLFDKPLFEYLWTYHAATLKNIQCNIRGLEDDDVRDGAVGLVTNCPLLENLTFRLRFPFFDIARFLDAVLGALDRERTSLKSLRMTFRCLISSRRALEEQLENEFVPRFTANGIHLIMQMKD